MGNFKQRFGEWALVAGATEGIGEQFSKQLAGKGMNIMLIARKQEGLDKVSEEIKKSHPDIKTDTLSLDLADEDLANKLSNFVDNREVGLFIYNAVYSYIGEFLEDNMDSRNLCLDVNCRGPLTFIDQLVPSMRMRNKGGIILVSSMSGFQGSAMVTTYAASKAFVTVLAEGLWEELSHHNIQVMACVAGATSTPNFERQTPEEKAKSVMPMAPKQVVTEALDAFEKGIGPTFITGKLNRFVNVLFGKVFTRKQAVNTISKATRKLYS